MPKLGGEALPDSLKVTALLVRYTSHCSKFAFAVKTVHSVHAV